MILKYPDPRFPYTCFSLSAWQNPIPMLLITWLNLLIIRFTEYFLSQVFLPSLTQSTNLFRNWRHLGLHDGERKESEVTQSCPTPCDPMDCSPPGSSVHEIFQARVLEWGAISFSRGSSPPRDQTRISCVSCIVGRLFTSTGFLFIDSFRMTLKNSCHLQ